MELRHYNGPLRRVNNKTTNRHSYSMEKSIICSFIYLGNDELIHLLLKKGANINQKDNDGRTALHLATLNGNLPKSL